MPPTHSAREDHGETLYVSLELGQLTWLVTSLSPGSTKMSKYSSLAGNGSALLSLLERVRARAVQAASGAVNIVMIQEAGLDGFWVHRLRTRTGSRATWLILHRSAFPDGSAERRPTPLW
jgi:transposase